MEVLNYDIYEIILSNTPPVDRLNARFVCRLFNDIVSELNKSDEARIALAIHYISNNLDTIMPGLHTVPCTDEDETIERSKKGCVSYHHYVHSFDVELCKDKSINVSIYMSKASDIFIQNVETLPFCNHPKINQTTIYLHNKELI